MTKEELEELSQDILEETMQTTLNELDGPSVTIPIRDFTLINGDPEKVRSDLSAVTFSELYRKLGSSMSINEISTGDKKDKANIARATLFVASALGSLFVRDRLRDNIDKYFESELRDDLLSFDDREKLRQELKNKATEAVKRQANNPAASRIIDKLDQGFSDIENGKNSSQSKNMRESLGNCTERFVGCGMSMLTELNNAINNDGKEPRDIATAVGIVKKMISDDDKDLTGKRAGWKYGEFNKTFCEVLDDVVKDADELAKASMTSFTKTDIGFSVDKSAEVQPLDFLRSVKEAKESHPNDPDAARNIPEEKWAVSFYDRNLSEFGLENLVVDGKPMFTKSQLSKMSRMSDNAKKIEVVNALLSGKEVMAKNEKSGETTFLNPQLQKATGAEKKTWWESFVDFIKDLFGVGSKEKEQRKAMEETFANNLREFDGKKHIKEKISFNELSGINSLKKATTMVSQDRSKEKKAPSIGM